MPRAISQGGAFQPTADYNITGDWDFVTPPTVAGGPWPAGGASTLTGTTLAPTVVTSSLTSLGTLSALTMGADISLMTVPSDLGGSIEVTTNAKLYVANTFDSGAIFIDQIGTATAGAGLVTRHAGGTAAAPTDVTNNLQLGYIDYRGYSGTKFWQCASLSAVVDGTFVSGQAPPSRINFSTNLANGGSTERMRLTAAGSLLINTTAVLSGIADNAKLQVKGLTNDYTVGILAAPSSGAAYGLRCHTTPVTAADFPLVVSAGASGGFFAVNGLGNTIVGGFSGNANAVLDVQSTTKAFMPPRMTTTQRDAIAGPTAGMVVYNSTTGKLNVRGAAAWEAVTSA